MTGTNSVSLCDNVNRTLARMNIAGVTFSSGVLHVESEICGDKSICEYLGTFTDKKYESWVMFSDSIVRNCSVGKLCEKINDLLEAEFFFADESMSLRIKRLNDNDMLVCTYRKADSLTEESDVCTHVSLCVRQDILHFDDFDETKVRYALWYRNDDDRMVPYAQIFEGFEK